MQNIISEMYKKLLLEQNFSSIISIMPNVNTFILLTASHSAIYTEAYFNSMIDSIISIIASELQKKDSQKDYDLCKKMAEEIAKNLISSFVKYFMELIDITSIIKKFISEYIIEFMSKLNDTTKIFGELALEYKIFDKEKLKLYKENLLNYVKFFEGKSIQVQIEHLTIDPNFTLKEGDSYTCTIY